MSALLTFLAGLSLLGLFAIALYKALRFKTWRVFAFHLVILVVCFGFLYALFDFPFVDELTSRGSGENEIYLVILLYFFMILGMACQAFYVHFEQPRKKRKKKKFDFGSFVAPVFASPIVFIPLMAAMQNADIDLSELTLPRMMVFFVAFENGFFWKDLIDHRRKEQFGDKDDS